MPRPTASAAWHALQQHRQQIVGTTLEALFAADPQRAETLSIEASGLTLDYSKQPLTSETLNLLCALAVDAEVPAQIEALMQGEKLNFTEHRAAWHTALRAGDEAPEVVKRELARMETFSDALRAGQWRGYNDDVITDVVNLGVGGSDLGPRMVCHALSGEAQTGPRVHFVANADGAELALTLRELSPATTLFIVASKSFGTAETTANAADALRWFHKAGVDNAAREQHFVTVSANPEASQLLGVPEENNFLLWDWVGGRFSLWSAVGLAVAIAIGMPGFRALLSGAKAMDTHFANTELPENMPILLALIGIWQSNFLGVGQEVVLPYSHYLEYLPAYLQQLEMESNGKRVDSEDQVVDYTTASSTWGQAGTNGQHAFLQWLHQGMAQIPTDFVLPIEVPLQNAEQQRFMVASCLAQSAVLMRGHDGAGDAEVPTYRKLPGNRPSNTLLLKRLDAYHLGALLALYEHKVFVQSVIWDVNAFDQWAVEHGKSMATGLINELSQGQIGAHDPSTQRLAELFMAQLSDSNASQD